MKTFIYLLILFSSSFAQILGDPVALTQHTFNAKSIEQKNIILSEKQAQQLSKASQQAIDTKIYRIYIAKNGSSTIGYGVLLNKKVRTKTAIALYLIDMEYKIKSIEIVAFNEPIEYLPTKTWLDGFDNKNSTNALRLNQDIPTVSGATLSARAITDGSRIALSLINIIKP
ncbi:MAG: FMN-binding protein [Thiovulaceae bacterium]|nr:FMN-binding protein [Sulfurimonadaceae bacterium]